MRGNFEHLVFSIEKLHDSARQSVAGSVNRMLTLRNWLIGRYIVEYEQNGRDRAKYGTNLILRLARRLNARKGFSERNLQLFREFYRVYPQIARTAEEQLSAFGVETGISQKASAELQSFAGKKTAGISIPIDRLICHFSFSHFIELFL